MKNKSQVIINGSYILLVAILILVIFSAVNYELFSWIKATPPDTTYHGTIGYFFDYNQFLTFIKAGENGQYNTGLQQAKLGEETKPLQGTKYNKHVFSILLLQKTNLRLEWV